MGQRKFSALFICFLLLPLFSLPARAEVSVEASLSSHSFPVDSAAKLTITVTGTRSAEIKMKEIDGLQFHSQGQSSRINIINGSYSSAISNLYLIQPLQPGTYTIPPISIITGKATVQTEPITFEVTAIGQGHQSSKQNKNTSAGENDVAFILVSEIDRHYTGEIVPLRIKAYFNRKYQWAPISSPPALKADGVVMSPLSNEPEQSQEQLKGVIYHVLSWNTTLSGIKAGRHPVLFELDATLLLRQQQRSRSPFGGSPFNDSFFDNFFGGLQRKPIQVTSPELHFETIAKSVELPIILYNVPGRTSMNLKPSMVAELAKIDNIVAVKEASGDLAQVAEVARLVPDDFAIYSGNDDSILQLLSVGGHGVISVLANVCPQETHDLVQNFFDGDIEGARKLQLDMKPLIDALFIEVNPIPVKTAMNLLGFGVGNLRLPLAEMDEKNLEVLKQELVNRGFKL